MWSTPRNATAARSPSSSNASSTTSAMAIGKTRVSQPTSGPSRPRPARARRRPASTSAPAGRRRSGGVVRASWASSRPALRIRPSRSRMASASRRDRCRSPSEVLAGSRQKAIPSPSASGTNAAMSGATSRSPCSRRRSSRATDGLRRPTVWASVGTRAPGTISLVSAAPPSRSRASRTSVASPARASRPPATRPLWPPPTTIASQPSRGAPAGPAPAVTMPTYARRPRLAARQGGGPRRLPPASQDRIEGRRGPRLRPGDPVRP